MVMSSPLAGAEMITFFAPPSRWAEALGGVGEDARGLDDQVHSHLRPGDLGRVSLGEDLDLGPVDDEGAVAGFHIASIGAVVGVVLKEVGVGLGVGQVVDSCHLKFVGVAFLGCPEDLASDSAKTVDSHSSDHYSPPKTDELGLRYPVYVIKGICASVSGFPSQLFFYA